MALGFDGSGGFGGDFYAGYKHIYNPKRVAVLAYERRPFMKRLTKRDDFVGDTYNHSIFFEDPQGGSANQQTAINQKQASSQGARFVINRGREYQVISILNEEIQASRDDVGSLLRKKKHESDRVINEMARRMDIAIHGGGGGVIASFTTGSSVATTSLTLDTPQLGIRFSVRQVLQCVSTNNTNGTANTFVAGGATARVLGLSRSATTTTITLDQTLAQAWPGIATSTQYFLVRNGDNIGFSYTNPAGGVSGLKSWLPTTAPTVGDSFWGFDRSVDVQRLAGVRYAAGNGEKYEQTFQQASAELALQESNADVILMSPVDCAKYSQELGNKVRYSPNADGVTGFRPLLVTGQSGDLEVLPDPQVDPGTFYMLDMDTWHLKTLGALPHLVEDDGRPTLREATSDAVEIRWRGWYQLISDAPGRNLVGTFAA
jgi:hypothetical protein